MSATNVQSSRTEQLERMPDRVIRKLWELLAVQSSSDNEKRMVLFLVDQLRAMGLDSEIDSVGNILVTKGNSTMYPCIVAHLDTVHRIVDDYTLHLEPKQERDIAFATSNGKETGIGGDDKCGIFACTYMLRHFDNLKVVFFTQEESGMPGSHRIDHKWFDNVGYIIQLDRWGRSDLICINGSQKTVSKEFLNKAAIPMKQYGYTKEQGLITDSINLWNNNIGISCVNVSCGYYQHHTASEQIDLNELWNSLLFTHDLIKALGEKRYESKPTYKRYSNKNVPSQNWLRSFGNDFSDGYRYPATRGGQPSLPFQGTIGIGTPGDDSENDVDDVDDILTAETLPTAERDAEIIEFIEDELRESLYLPSMQVLTEAYEIFNSFYVDDGVAPVSYTEFTRKIYDYYHKPSNFQKLCQSFTSLPTRFLTSPKGIQPTPNL